MVGGVVMVVGGGTYNYIPYSRCHCQETSEGVYEVYGDVLEKGPASHIVCVQVLLRAACHVQSQALHFLCS